MMKTPMKRKHKKSESGMATVEAIPLLVIFIIFVAYGMGFFGQIHTAILGSIAARTFAFETFRNRTVLVYHRDTDTVPQHFQEHELRFHGTQPESSMDASFDYFTGTSRPIAIGLPIEAEKRSIEDHNVKVYQLEARNQEVGMSPVWVKVGYGICLKASCGQ